VVSSGPGFAGGSSDGTRSALGKHEPSGLAGGFVADPGRCTVTTACSVGTVHPSPMNFHSRCAVSGYTSTAHRTR